MAFIPGSATKLWPFPVDWSTSYRVTIAFKTDMNVSRSGKEQRRALRSTPRKTVEFSCLATKEKFRSFRRLMASWQNKSMVMPEMTRWVTIDSPAGGGPTIQVDALADFLAEDSKVVLINGSAMEVRTVESAAGHTVTFTTGGATWPAGTRVYPGLEGRVGTSLTSSNLSDSVAKFPVDFDVEPCSEPLRTAGGALAVLAGQEVLTLQPNWISNVQVRYTHEVEQVDYGRGRVTTFSPVAFGTEVFQATYSGFSAAKMILLQQFFERMKGKRDEFYMSTGLDDLTPKVALANGGLYMRVAGQEVFDAYATDTVHRAVDVVLNNGSHVYRKIESITAINDGAGADTMIKMTQAWASLIPLDTIKRVSWLPLCRFASDQLTLEWVTNQVGQAQYSIQTLENLPAEVE